MTSDKAEQVDEKWSNSNRRERLWPLLASDRALVLAERWAPMTNIPNPEKPQNALR